MSAFMVDNIHIDALLTAAMAYGDGGQFIWYKPEADDMKRFTLSLHTADETGALLLAENRASVNFRYREDEIEQIYTYHSVPWSFGSGPDPVVVLKLIACYEYQSCEHDTWSESAAKAFCSTLQSYAIHNLHGYEAAPWSLSEDDRTTVFTRPATKTGA